MHPITKWILRLYIAFYARVRTVYEKLIIGRQIGYWALQKESLLRAATNGYRCKLEDLGINADQLKTLKNGTAPSHDAVIAEIDHDGFLLSHIGPINEVPIVEHASFMTRKRFQLQVVAIDGYAGVKKYFDGDKHAFIREIKALYRLSISGCNVPALLDADFKELTLTFSFILGDVLREKLAEKGAIVRDRDVNRHPKFKELTPMEAWYERIKEGRRVLPEVVDSQFVDKLFSQLTQIHAAGFILDDIKYGNIIIEKKSGSPYIIDYDHAHDYPGLSKHAFSLLCDRDIEKFNLHFGTTKPTGRQKQLSVYS